MIENLITVGYIQGAFGINGWVKVKSLTEERTAILSYSPWHLLLKDGRHNARRRQCEVLDVTVNPRHIAVQIDNCYDRDQARVLGGSQIAVERNQLPSLQPGDYYWTDLIGLQVLTVNKVLLGKVDSLLRTGANDVLVVQSENKRQCLIPYIPDRVLKEIDLIGGYMVVDWEDMDSELCIDDEPTL